MHVRVVNQFSLWCLFSHDPEQEERKLTYQRNHYASTITATLTILVYIYNPP